MLFELIVVNYIRCSDNVNYLVIVVCKVDMCCYQTTWISSKMYQYLHEYFSQDTID